MSPRSEEFMAMARDRLALAAAAVEIGHPEGAVSAAYYAMLYAARAALSEEDANAKTHRGTWDLFHQVFVATGRFDAELTTEARDVARRREAVDYDARTVEPREAQAVFELAERFVAAADDVVA